MEAENLKTYLVVDFPLFKSKDGKLCLDVVPRNRLIGKTKDGWTCAFPKDEEFSKKRRWVWNQKKVKPDWPKYSFLILSSTDDYKKANERLDRAMTTSNIESASDGQEAQHSQDDQEESTSSRAQNQKNRSITEKDASDILDQVAQYSMNPFNKSQDLFPTSEISRRYEDASPGFIDLNLEDREKDPTIDFNANELVSTPINREKSRQKHPLSSPCDDLHRPKKQKSYDINMEELVALIDTKIRQECASMESRILAEIRKSKRSTEYKLKKQFEQLMNTMRSNGLNTKIDLLELKKRISDHPLPIKNEIIFDELLANIEEKSEVKEALVEFIKFKRCHRSKPKELLEIVLKYMMAKEIQLLYSGCGKLQKGVGNENFSATSLFECLSVEVINYFPEEATSTKLVSLASRFLANAGDRDGGKRLRDLMRPNNE